MSEQPDLAPWTTLTRETLLSSPPFLSVERHRVALPDGRVIDDWQWVVTGIYPSGREAQQL